MKKEKHINEEEKTENINVPNSNCLISVCAVLTNSQIIMVQRQLELNRVRQVMLSSNFVWVRQTIQVSAGRFGLLPELSDMLKLPEKEELCRTGAILCARNMLKLNLSVVEKQAIWWQ